MAELTHYDILDIDRDATPAEVRKAYMRIARMKHPDKNNSAEATALFQKALDAYEVLGNEDLRDAYDAGLEQAAAAAAAAAVAAAAAGEPKPNDKGKGKAAAPPEPSRTTEAKKPAAAQAAKVDPAPEAPHATVPLAAAEPEAQQRHGAAKKVTLQKAPTVKSMTGSIGGISIGGVDAPAPTPSKPLPPTPPSPQRAGFTPAEVSYAPDWGSPPGQWGQWPPDPWDPSAAAAGYPPAGYAPYDPLAYAPRPFRSPACPNPNHPHECHAFGLHGYPAYIVPGDYTGGWNHRRAYSDPAYAFARDRQQHQQQQLHGGVLPLAPGVGVLPRVEVVPPPPSVSVGQPATVPLAPAPAPAVVETQQQQQQKQRGNKPAPAASVKLAGGSPDPKPADKPAEPKPAAKPKPAEPSPAPAPKPAAEPKPKPAAVGDKAAEPQPKPKLPATPGAADPKPGADTTKSPAKPGAPANPAPNIKSATDTKPTAGAESKPANDTKSPSVTAWVKTTSEHSAGSKSGAAGKPKHAVSGNTLSPKPAPPSVSSSAGTIPPAYSKKVRVDQDLRDFDDRVRRAGFTGTRDGSGDDDQTHRVRVRRKDSAAAGRTHAGVYHFDYADPPVQRVTATHTYERSKTTFSFPAGEKRSIVFRHGRGDSGGNVVEAGWRSRI